MRAGAVQLNSTEDIDRNMETADRLVREAAAAGAELVILPEKWNVLGRPEVMAAAAEPLDGPALTWARAAAAELGIELVAGSIVERVEGQQKTANTSVHFTPSGRMTVYRKLHMFDVEVDGVLYAESANERAGEEVVVSTLSDGGAGGVRIGMSICYDVRFPELYRELSARGAEVVAIPSAFTLATTRDHWEVLLRARAIENQCFVVAANQIGAHPSDQPPARHPASLSGPARPASESSGSKRSGGRSMIVDPWGVVLACAPDTEGVIVAQLDFAQLREIRRRLPALMHRRPEIYERSLV
ncbi:MAG: carbon-nitrogen hydrolase family protein [Solirubrobacteraceae bacterium]